MVYFPMHLVTFQWESKGSSNEISSGTNSFMAKNGTNDKNQGQFQCDYGSEMDFK